MKLAAGHIVLAESAKAPDAKRRGAFLLLGGRVGDTPPLPPLLLRLPWTSPDLLAVRGSTSPSHPSVELVLMYQRPQRVCAECVSTVLGTHACSLRSMDPFGGLELYFIVCMESCNEHDLSRGVRCSAGLQITVALCPIAAATPGAVADSSLIWLPL